MRIGPFAGAFTGRPPVHALDWLRARTPRAADVVIGAAIAVIVLALSFRGQFIKGLTAGAVKR